MARYIDADKLTDKIFPMGLVDDGRYTINAKAVKYAIDQTSTADVVEVVRCRDCINNPGYVRLKGMVWCRKFRGDVHPNGYCSYGERKGGSDDKSQNELR